MSLMNNMGRPSVFFDASALFAAIFSEVGGARMILKLAEGGLIDLVISSQVLAEVESALRRKAPGVMGALLLLLDRSHCRVVPNPPLVQVDALVPLIAYRPDAAVLAAAIAAQADYLVTLDRRHFLENARLVSDPPLPIGSPGDCLAWFRQRLA